MEATQLARPRTRVAMVVPPYAFVTAPVADVRATPDGGAELVDQLHYKEVATVLGSRGEWHYVQAQDHYFGWVHSDVVEVLGGRGGRCVGLTQAPVYETADRGSRVIGHLPAGTPIAAEQIPAPPEGWVRVPSKTIEIQTGAREMYLCLEDVTSLGDMPHRPPTADDLIATAEAFLGVPYLWGGTTALGMDCSGYVQQVYRLNGIRLDRDADQQAMEGRPVAEARAGDLLFFGESRVTHVALALGDDTLLHAPQSGAVVERGSTGTRKLRAIRRYLADPQ